MGAVGEPSRGTPLALAILLFSLLGWLAGVARGLHMTTLKIPLHVMLNQTVRMDCNFSLDQESLYSVKWYKDGHEFYRYVPKEQPNVHVFKLAGVNVDKYTSSEKSVVLNRVNRDSSGRYRCEVSAEAPAFNTISDHGDMTVVVLPERGPTITGGKPKYQLGDLVRMNCTSAPSKPAATLTWYINEASATQEQLKGPHTSSPDASGLQQTQLILEFRAESRHFRHGDMKLKCIAAISSVYKRSYEQRAAGDGGFLKQPMESRETRAQSHTRSDYSPGSKARASAMATILSILSIFAARLFPR